MVPDLSLVIITWNQAERLKACLESVFAQQSRHTFEVVVVVNGSQDHTLQVLEHFPQVRSIRNKTNRGVAPARNQGIAAAGGRILMMLDDDTLMHPACIERVIDFMDSHPDAWGGGTKTFAPSGALEYNARTFYTIPIILFRRTPLGKWFPQAGIVRKHLMTDWDHQDSRPVDWVSGASFIMTREAVESIGAFDEHFFFGFEDVDWCYRVQLEGKRIYYLADASIVHHIQGSSRRFLSVKAWYHLRSFLYFYQKHFF